MRNAFCRVLLVATLVGGVPSYAVAQSAGDSIPLPEHPRPDFERADWQNLNGRWRFRFDAADEGERAGWERAPLERPRTIRVPFSWGAPLSGVPDSASIGWYERTIEAMPVKPTWTSSTSNYFAPDVEQRGDQFVMYYAAQINSGDYCIGMATSSTAAGPYTDVGSPVVCGSGFTTIDPMGFDDPQTGKHYLYWGSGFGPIKVQELSANDRHAFAAGSAPVDVLLPRNANDPSAYDTGLIEGAWVTYVTPWYYLYFSGNGCCGAGAHYAVMVARSTSPTGPFEVLTAGGPGTAATPILHAGGPWLAPGHNSTVKDAAGAEWMVYHAISSTNRYLFPGNPDISRRPMLIDRITYVNGWATVGTSGTPTSTPQTRPASTP